MNKESDSKKRRSRNDVPDRFCCKTCSNQTMYFRYATKIVPLVWILKLSQKLVRNLYETAQDSFSKYDRNHER